MQPLNAIAKTQLEKPLAWRRETDWQRQLDDTFAEQWPVKPNAAAKIVLNALLAWSKTLGIPLPTVNDLSQWPKTESKVVMLRPSFEEKIAEDTAQAHVHRIAQKLPNLWRFLTNEDLPHIVEAMNRARTAVIARERSADVGPVL